MKNETTFTSEQLELFFIFDMFEKEKDNKTRLMWDFGQDRKEPSSLRKTFKLMGFSELEKTFKQLERQGQLNMFWDDGTFHMTFQNELLSGLDLEQFEEL